MPQKALWCSWEPEVRVSGFLYALAQVRVSEVGGVGGGWGELRRFIFHGVSDSDPGSLGLYPKPPAPLSRPLAPVP